MYTAARSPFTWTPTEPRAGLPITFTGSASGTLPMTYTWDLGDFTRGEGNPIPHIYGIPVARKLAALGFAYPGSPAGRPFVSGC